MCRRYTITMVKLVLKEEAPVDAYLISCYQFKEDFR